MLIREIYNKSKGRYGSPKITHELRKRGIQISRPRVARIMRKANIRSIVHKRFRVQTTDSNHNYTIAQNLLNRDRPPTRFVPDKTGKAWVSDITAPRGPILKLWKDGGRPLPLYLTTVIDLGDRKVIGWSLSQTMQASDTVISAWKMAAAVAR
jgi:putative transposase